MTLEELLSFFSTDNESDRRLIIIEAVNQRLGSSSEPACTYNRRKSGILTMHGAKGLSGKVVFIPSVEQGIMPSFRAIQATGLLLEQRRLFYVSVTRAMASVHHQSRSIAHWSKRISSSEQSCCTVAPFAVSE